MPAAAQAPATPTAGAIDGWLSPDGITVLARTRDGASVRLLVVSPYDSTAAPRWVTPAGSDVDTAAWTPDGGALVYQLASDGHLYVVPADGGAEPRDITPQATSPARLAGFTTDGTAAFVELAATAGGYPALYRVGLDGGQLELVQPSAPGVVRWAVEGDSVRLGVRELEAGDREIVRPRGAALVPVLACTSGAACDPVAFHPDGRVWVRSAAGDNALLLLDPLGLTTEVARADLGVDTRAVFREDSTYARAVEDLAALLPGADIQFLEEPQGGGGRMLIAAEEAGNAALYVFDRWAGTVTALLPFAAAGGAGSALAPDVSLAWPEQLTYRIADADPALPSTEVRRRIRRTTEDGQPVIEVVDEAEVPVFEAPVLDTLMFQDPTFDPELAFSFDQMEMEDATDEVVLDASTLRPISRRASGPLELELDFEMDGVSGVMELGGFATRLAASAPTAGQPLWTDGAALELLVAALPLAEGYAVEVAYFDTGAQAAVVADLAVRGAARADVEAGSFDAWTVTVSPRGGAASPQTWLVRRTAPHLLLRSTLRTRDFTRVVELIGGLTP
jgi:hypothetical protein